MEEPRATLGRTFLVGVGNQKGGVAKSTVTLNLGAALAEAGRQVLLVDCDANCGITRALGIPESDFLGTHEVMLGDEKPEDVYLARGDSDLELPERLYVIPGRRSLNHVTEELVSRGKKFISPASLLREPIRRIAFEEPRRFDYVFLDTGPQTPPPTLSAYMASEFFILSAFPERDALEGLRDAMSDIRDARDSGNDRLRLAGVIMSAVDRRTTLARTVVQYVSEKFTDAMFETAIPSSVVVKNARNACQTVLDYAPRHKVADAYRALAREFEARLLSMSEVAMAAAAEA